MARGRYSQSKKSRLDESLGVRRGKESTKKQSFASRRHESEGMERHLGRGRFSAIRALASHGTRHHVHGMAMHRH